MAKMVRFFDNVYVDDGGIEINNIIGAIKYIHTGEIQQVTIEKKSGTATELVVQIRYLSGIDDLNKLVYLYEGASIDPSGFIDSDIKAPFSCVTKNTEGDLSLFVQAGAGTDCYIDMRIDFDINNLKGL